MPLPGVLVDIAPPEPPAEAVETLLRACNDGLRFGECRTGVSEEDDTRASASVVWLDQDRYCAEIDVSPTREHMDDGSAVRICFEPTDPELERWRAVGFTIATLADREAPPEVASQAEVGPRPPAPTPEIQRGWASWLGLGILAGPGLDSGGSRWGIRASATQDLAQSPLLVTGSFRWTMSANDDPVSARWAGFSLGMGGHATAVDTRLSFRFEIIAENLSVVARDPRTGATDEGDRWVPGFMLGGGVAWPSRGPVALHLGGEAWRLRDGTAVTLFDRRVASWPAFGWSLAAGLDLRLR